MRGGVIRYPRRPLGPVVPRSRPEGVRWVRGDGSPNWSQRVAAREGGIKALASSPPIGVRRTTPVLGAAEAISRKGVRGLVVSDARDRLEGVLLATDIVNYLGGGHYYRLALERHRGNLYSALAKEPVASIMSRQPASIRVSASVEDALRVMVGGGYGFLPVVYDDGTLYGVVTERDLVRAFGKAPYDKKIEDYMTSSIVVVEAEASIGEAARTMVSHGFRRLPVVNSSMEITGIVTAKDLVSFYGSHEAFKYSRSGSLEEVLGTPIRVVARPGFATVHPKLSVADAARIMIDKGVDSLIVAEGGEALGIITERDVLVAAVVEEVQ